MLEILQNVFMPLEEMRNKAYPIEMHRLRNISSNEEQKMYFNAKDYCLFENNTSFIYSLTVANCVL